MKRLDMTLICVVGIATPWLASCGKADVAGADASASTQRTVLGPHVVTFSGVDSFSLGVGGVHPLALALDPSSPSVAITADDLKRENPPAFAYTAQVQCGIAGRQEPPTKPLTTLGFMHVKTLDVELEASVSDGKPTVEDPSRMCFGARVKDGSWRWTLREVVIRYEPSTVRMRAVLDVDPSVETDAFVIVINGPISLRAPAKITYEVVAPP